MFVKYSNPVREPSSGERERYGEKNGKHVQETRKIQGQERKIDA